MLNNFDALDGDENAGGAPWFQIIAPSDIDSIPDKILNRISSAVVLNGGATAFNIKPVVGTVRWSEVPKEVEGRDSYTSVCSFVIAKDRVDVLEYSIHLYNKGVVAIVRDANGQSRLMGTANEPASFRRVNRTIGSAEGERNEHRYEIVITGGHPVPFYEVTTSLPAPANGACPAVNSITVDAYSDAGFTTSITDETQSGTIYLKAVPSVGFTPTEYVFFYEDADGLLWPIDHDVNDNSSWTVAGAPGDGKIFVAASDDGDNYIGAAIDFEVLALDRLLDVYTDVILCNSLINRRVLFTNAVARDRRSSDNDVADFTPTAAFEPPQLDDDSIASNSTPSSHNGDTLAVFNAGTDGHVTTMYNQCASGGLDLVESNVSYQPKIVSTGILSELGGKPAMLFDGSSTRLLGWSHTTAPSAFQTLDTAISVAFRFNANEVSGTVSSSWLSYYSISILKQNVASPTVSLVPFAIGIDAGKVRVGFSSAAGTDVFDSTATVSIGVNYSVGVSIDGTTVKIYIDGALDSTHTITSATGTRAIGTDTSTYAVGVRTREGGQSDRNYYKGYLVGDAPIIAPSVYTAAQFLDIHTNYQA